MKGLKEEILFKIKKYIATIDPSSEVILFGSQARNEERENSDWDILILTNLPTDLKGEQKFRHKLFELELEYGVAFSTFVYSKQEWNDKHYVTPLYQNIQQDGIRI